MKKTKIIIIDNNNIDQMLLISMLSQIEEIELIGAFSNAMSAWSILREQEVDLILLDIQLPEISGLEFISTLSHPTQAIVVSALSNLAIDAFDVGAVDFLVKPVSFPRLLKAVNKVQNKSDKAVNPSLRKREIFLKAGRELTRIYIDEIIYIEAFGAFCKVFTIHGVKTVSNMLMNIAEFLPQEEFARVHRSYLVALSRITSIGANKVQVDNLNIPLGATYRKKIYEMLYINLERGRK